MRLPLPLTGAIVGLLLVAAFVMLGELLSPNHAPSPTFTCAPGEVYTVVECQ